MMTMKVMKSMIILMMIVIVMMTKKKKKLFFNEGRNIITGCKTGVIFIMALYPGLFGVTVSHAGQFLLVLGLSLWIAVIFPCLFREQSLHPSLTELLFQLPLLDG